MARLDEIVAWLDDLLEPQAFVDYCPNGLQVPGAQEVRRVATGVSAGLELFERAGGSEADL
ncbi:MAG: Nif3-like dinuclear metal center hexameric protein, partial [Solirubrobacterales bacterium]